VSPPNSFCLDFYPWTYSYTRHYSRVEGAEERERAVAAAGEKLRAAAAARQPQVDAYMARMNELSTRYAEAVTSGDEARVQAANLEMEQFKVEYERFISEDDSAKVFEAATAKYYMDLEMSVGVTVNPTRESPQDGAQPLTVPGAASAYQWISDAERGDGGALLLFGEWQPSPSGYGLEAVTPDGAAPEKPHAISIRINAHKDRIPAMIEATDIEAVAALLAR
jgi:hypothetical protein